MHDDRAQSSIRHCRRGLLGVGVCATLLVGGIACGGATGGGTTSASAGDSLLTQLQSLPEVREHLLGTADVKDLVLCGIQELGRDRATDEIYVWLYCGSYRTGSDAENVSAGADPAVVSVDGKGESLRVIEVSFPPMGDHPQDIRRLFPDVLADRILGGRLTFKPTEAELLDKARATCCGETRE